MEKRDIRKSFNKTMVLLIIGLICLVFVFVGVFPAATSLLGITPIFALLLKIDLLTGLKEVSSLH